MQPTSEKPITSPEREPTAHDLVENHVRTILRRLPNVAPANNKPADVRQPEPSLSEPSDPLGL